MTFNGQYLDYSTYKALGGTLEQSPFNILEYNARKKIDERTFGRLIGIETIPEEVKILDYELINVLESYSNIATGNKGVTSENIDGYSVTYTTPNKSINEAINNELEANINTYLSNTIINNVPVLYRGTK